METTPTGQALEQYDAAQLRKLGLLGLLTGDRTLAQTGGAVLDQAEAQQRATTGSRYASIGNGFILDPATGKISRDPNYAEYERKRDELEHEARRQLQADQLERLGYSADLRARQPRYSVEATEGGIVPVQVNPNAAGGAGAGSTIPVQRPLPDNVRLAAAESERTAREARSLHERLKENPGAISTPAELSKRIVGATPLVGEVLAEQVESAAYSPEEKQIRTLAQNLLNQHIKNITGAQMSQYEIERIRAAFPFDERSTYESAMARFPEFIRILEEQGATLRGVNQSGGSRRIRVDAEGNVIGD
jgi:hypothetical protein